jgi:hypothetical protein
VLATVCALTVALVPDLGLDLRLPGRAAPSPGSVRAVRLDLGAGTPLGPVAARGDKLVVAPGARGMWLSAPLPLDSARMVALSWSGDAKGRPGAAWARTESAAGWTSWEQMEAEATEPDPGTGERMLDGRGTTDGLWTGDGSRAVQFRVELDPRDGRSVGGLTAHMIDPGGDPGSALGLDDRGGVGAMTETPTIISRKEWGADERLRRAPARYAATIRAAFVHHTANAGHYTREQSPALVRSIYLFHTRVRGYNDIGYNFLIDRFGQVFEGRAGGIAAAVVGAHTGGFNTGSFGVAAIGHHDQDAVPAATQVALRNLLAWKLDVYHVDPEGVTWMRSGGGGSNRHPVGQWIKFRTISLHRDASRTICPGARLASLVPDLRVAVARTGAPKIYGGMPSTRALHPGGGRTVVLAPRFSAQVRWRAVARDAAGRAVRRWRGRGRAGRISWNGRTAAGKAIREGPIVITVTASTSRRSARALAVRVRLLH